MRSKRPTEPSPLTAPQAYYLARRFERIAWLLIALAGLIFVALVVR